MPVVALFHRVGQDLLNLVFPPHCVICRAGGAVLCDACVEHFPRVQPPWCECCGEPAAGGSPLVLVRRSARVRARLGDKGAQGGGRVCQPCQQTPPEIDGIRSVVLLEGGARDAVHRLKYGGCSSLAPPLARLMAEYWRVSPLPADVVAHVPLYIARQRERGYNQAHLLGRELGRLLGLPPVSGTLTRARNTRAQVGLDACQRHANVRGAFEYESPRRGDGVRGLRVLLVDDVCTTGATLEACSAALKAAGAASVWGLTLARAAWSS